MSQSPDIRHKISSDHIPILKGSNVICAGIEGRADDVCLVSARRDEGWIGGRREGNKKGKKSEGNRIEQNDCTVAPIVRDKSM